MVDLPMLYRQLILMHTVFLRECIHIKNTVVKAQRPMFNNNLKFSFRFRTIKSFEKIVLKLKQCYRIKWPKSSGSSIRM